MAGLLFLLPGSQNLIGVIKELNFLRSSDFLGSLSLVTELSQLLQKFCKIL